MEATTTKSLSNTYRWTILSAYVLGMGLNLWLLREIMKETEEGREILERLNNQTLGRFRSWKNSFFESVDSQMVINEAEEILRSNNGN